MSYAYTVDGRVAGFAETPLAAQIAATRTTRALELATPEWWTLTPTELRAMLPLLAVGADRPFPVIGPAILVWPTITTGRDGQVNGLVWARPDGRLPIREETP